MSKRRERDSNSSISSQEKSPTAKVCKMTSQHEEHVELEPTLEMIYKKLTIVEENTSKLVNDISNLKENYTALKASLETQELKINELEFKINDYIDDGALTSSKVSLLTDRLSKLEENQDEIRQYQRKYNVEIHGIPERENEDLEDIIEELGKEIKAEVDSGDIDIVHRQISRLNPRPILVKFRFYESKKNLYEARWRLKRYEGDEEKLNGAERIFINEHLTSERKKLYAEVRKRAKQYKWASFQTRDGKIFVKKFKGGKSHKIEKQADLEELYMDS